MKKQLIGIYTHLYTFPATPEGRKDYNRLKEKCKKAGGTTIERFINNQLAFEHTLKKIY